MQVHDCPLSGLKRIELRIHGDARGFFVERFNQARFTELGIPTTFVQDNHSRSAPGIIRGLHYQTGPAQGKLVGVIRGTIWDVAVDIRPDSPTFGQYFAAILSDKNGHMLWIPEGFAHGFCVMGSEPADVLYKVTAPYHPAGEGGIHFADPDLAIAWPVTNPLFSERDAKLPSFFAYSKEPPVWNL